MRKLNIVEEMKVADRFIDSMKLNGVNSEESSLLYEMIENWYRHGYSKEGERYLQKYAKIR